MISFEKGQGMPGVFVGKVKMQKVSENLKSAVTTETVGRGGDNEDVSRVSLQPLLTIFVWLKASPEDFPLSQFLKILRVFRSLWTMQNCSKLISCQRHFGISMYFVKKDPPKHDQPFDTHSRHVSFKICVF